MNSGKIIRRGLYCSSLLLLALAISGCSEVQRDIPSPKGQETKETQDTGREPGTLRVLYWNIQNGMWYDQ